MTSEALDDSLLQQWVGKTETVSARVNAVTANALAATLDRPDHFDTGAGLPPLWHWAYFWHTAPQSELGPDGHPRRGGFLPPVPLPRRMWAGGRLTFSRPLQVEGDAARSSQVKSVSSKHGATGPLVFVTVRHELAQEGDICVTEEHDIVYREMPQPGAAAPAPKMAPAEAAWERTIVPDPVLLFRYSALTFNGHRIHYDRSYATEVEGYPGLIVHGPLIASLLLDLVRRERPAAAVTAFSFRAVQPLFDIHRFSVCGRVEPDGHTITLWAKTHDGQLAMRAEALLA